MADGISDLCPVQVDTSPRGIAISKIASIERGRLLDIAWAALDAGLLDENLRPQAAPKTGTSVPKEGDET